MTSGITRRGFLATGTAVGAGLVIGTHLVIPQRGRAAAPPKAPDVDAPPNAFVRIAPDDNTVTILSKHIEFGQGPYTGLATLIAEELDASWGQMRAEAAPAAMVYKNLQMGIQLTGGSSAIANSFMQMRKVGASMRAMLVGAAAEAWGVDASEIQVADGVISHPSGKTSQFGALAVAAMKRDVPKDVKLKDPGDFKLIGTVLPKLDTQAKIDGSARYTIDVSRPNQLVAMVERPSRFSATVGSFDDAAAKSVDGFVAAKKIGAGVAVYADGYWPAKQARHALKVTWDESKTEARSSAALIESFEKRLDAPGMSAEKRGDADARLASPGEGAAVLKADYVFPYLAHAPMEPLDCVMERTKDGGVEAWFGSQAPTIDQGAIAKTLGITPDKVKINVLFAGGSFGRRATGDAALAVEAAQVLAASPDNRPIKLIWTREDDIRGGYYRPLYVHRLEAVIGNDADKGKTIDAWRHRIVGQSIMAGTPFGGGKIDTTSVEGAHLPYALDHFSLELHTEAVGIPVLWWRSVGSTHTAYSTETFMDEVLAATGQDAVAGRLALLAEHKRHRGVLEAAASLAGWGTKPAEGHALGVALHKSFGTYVAQIADVSVGKDGMPVVHRVYCAVDCGIAINPNIVKAQIEGGIGYGLGAALYNVVDIEDGRVVQTNFDDYKPLRMGDMPEVEVTVIKSAEAPTGIGEPGTPPIAPAVANAFFTLTGKRVRNQPFSRALGERQ